MKILYLFLAGILGGVLAGMGMGGGTLTIPLLVLALGVGQLTAQFVNLVAFLPSGALALGMHIKGGLVEKNSVLIIVLPAAAVTAATSAFAADISETLLKQLFGGFLVLIGISSLIGNLVKKSVSRNKG